MTEPIKYSEIFSGIKKEFAKKYDKDNNNKLDTKEYSLFCKDWLEYTNSNKAGKNSSIFVAKQDAVKDYKPIISGSLNVTKKSNSTQTALEKNVNMVVNEAKKWDVEISPQLAEYWATKTEKIAKANNLPTSLLISIISQETHGNFQKNINSKNGAGPMQVVETSVKDFFPGAKGNRMGVYKLLNPKLLDEVLYTNKNGQKTLRYSNTESLRNACANDDEYGMKVGLLIFQMKYVEAVSKLKDISLKESIEKLKNKSIKLSEQENKTAIKIALANYNSVFRSYAPNVVDSLRKHGFDFKKSNLIKA